MHFAIFDSFGNGVKNNFFLPEKYQCSSLVTWKLKNIGVMFFQFWNTIFVNSIFIHSTFISV